MKGAHLSAPKRHFILTYLYTNKQDIEKPFSTGIHQGYDK